MKTKGVKINSRTVKKKDKIISELPIVGLSSKKERSPKKVNTNISNNKEIRSKEDTNE